MSLIQSSLEERTQSTSTCFDLIGCQCENEGDPNQDGGAVYHFVYNLDRLDRSYICRHCQPTNERYWGDLEKEEKLNALREQNPEKSEQEILL